MTDTTKTELTKAGRPDITYLLEPGEQMIWQGQSEPTTGSSGTGLYGWKFITLGAVIAAIAILYAYINQSPSALFVLVIAPIPVAVGITMLQIQRSITSRTSEYCLTNCHAIIIKKPVISTDYTTTIIDMAATDTVKMIEQGDGSGTLVFGRNANEEDYSFSDIPNVTEVYHMVQELQASARQK